MTYEMMEFGVALTHDLFSVNVRIAIRPLAMVAAVNVAPSRKDLMQRYQSYTTSHFEQQGSLNK